MKTIAYRIDCLTTHRIYFGITSRTLKQRWQQHCCLDRPNIYLKNCIKKYGKENFSITEIAQFDTYIEALEFEKMAIAFCQVNVCRFPHGIGMNMTDGGDEGNIGYKTTELHKKNLSAALTGKKKSLAHAQNISRAKIGEKNPAFGKAPSAKNIAEIAERMNGLGNPMRGKIGNLNPKYGKKRPENVRVKIAAANMRTAKKVEQISADGDVLATFDSTHAACRAVGIKNGVFDVCMGHQKTAGGFRWRFA